MQGRLTKKTCEYLKSFKDNIREKSCQLGLNKNEQMTQLLQFVYDYEQLVFTKEDFQKRKRVKMWFLSLIDVAQRNQAMNNVLGDERKNKSFVEHIKKKDLMELLAVKESVSHVLKKSKYGRRISKVLFIIWIKMEMFINRRMLLRIK